MKLIMISIAVSLFCAGCGSPLLDFGAGAGAGSALSRTIQGMKTDLERREAQLVDLYNQGVAQGMEKQKLDEIEQAIKDTRLGKETVEAGEKLLGVDWSDPKQTSGAIGLITMTAWGWLNRRQLNQTRKKYTAAKRGQEKFIRENGANGLGDKLYAEVGAARQKLGVS
jgi:hypothetical protein